MTSGRRRNAELSRAALLMAAGGVLVGLSQRATEIAHGPMGTAALAAGGVVIVLGLIFALRTFFRRSGGADQ